MTRARREKLSPVDNAWLRMDRPGNLMTICGVLMFAEPLDVARVRAMLERRFLRFARFRERPVERADGAYWEASSGFRWPTISASGVATMSPRIQDW